MHTALFKLTQNVSDDISLDFDSRIEPLVLFIPVVLNPHENASLRRVCMLLFTLFFTAFGDFGDCATLVKLSRLMPLIGIFLKICFR